MTENKSHKAKKEGNLSKQTSADSPSENQKINNSRGGLKSKIKTKEIKTMKKRNNKKGFTIVELVIVIAVIAILAAVLIPTFSNVISKANESAALQACRNEYTQAKIAIAVNGTDLKSGTVFESKGYYFEYKDGEFSAMKNYTPVAAKATELANGVKVYQDFGTALDANSAFGVSDGKNCPAIKIGQSGNTTVTNFKVYNDSGVVIESAASVACPNYKGVYFTRPAEGYYYVTYTIDATNYAGIIYVPALAE